MFLFFGSSGVCVFGPTLEVRFGFSQGANNRQYHITDVRFSLLEEMLSCARVAVILRKGDAPRGRVWEPWKHRQSVTTRRLSQHLLLRWKSRGKPRIPKTGVGGAVTSAYQFLETLAVYKRYMDHIDIEMCRSHLPKSRRTPTAMSPRTDVCAWLRWLQRF